MGKIPAILLLSISWFYCSGKAKADTTIIKEHLTAITKTDKFRNYQNTDQLDEVADYIKSVFEKTADTVYFQEYHVNGKIYKNVIASFGITNSKRIVVGAHYDVCGEQEGADDNASGVVGLLELSRLLKHEELNYRVDLVAYTLEEPPFFRSEYMGSYIHAKSLYDEGADVYGMISVEMIGYFSDEKHTQDYPLKILSAVYGNTGDYITLVKKYGAGKFAKKFSRKFKAAGQIRTKSFTGPKSLPGIDFSDHRNYWIFGYSALMITDTSFYRNKNYHQPTDTLETLDLYRMGKVIDGLLMALTSI